jgi:hypothetical protein
MLITTNTYTFTRHLVYVRQLFDYCTNFFLLSLFGIINKDSFQQRLFSLLFLSSQNTPHAYAIITFIANLAIYIYMQVESDCA